MAGRTFLGTRQAFRSCAPSSAYVDAEAPAAPKFPSCDALTKKWLNGFAKARRRRLPARHYPARKAGLPHQPRATGPRQGRHRLPELIDSLRV